MTMQAERTSPQSQDQIDVTLDAYDAKKVKAILLPTGWHGVTGEPVLTQFALGQAHSPISPTSFTPALRFMDSATNIEVTVPLKQIIGYSREPLPRGTVTGRSGA